MDKKRHLIFLHLPKNGGTTFNSIINRYYEGNEVFQVGYNADGKWNLNELKGLSEKEKEDISLITGHFSFGLHELFNAPFRYVTMLRHPVERTVSFYNYIKRQKQHRLLETVKNKSLIECVTQIKDFDVVNGQARKLSGVNDEKFMLSKAIKNLQNYFDFIGVQEYYDESLLLLKHKFNWDRINYTKKNVAKSKIDIGEELVEAIEKTNEIDLELYNIVLQNFFKELSTIPYLFDKKRIFQAKNKSVS